MTKSADPADSRNLCSRLNKIIGQLEAMKRMIEKDAGCEDLIIQVNAVKSAMHSFGRVVLEKGISTAMNNCLDGEDAAEAAEECSVLIGRFADPSK